MTSSEKKKKEKRSRNALVHGFYSKDFLLPWDDKNEFEELHNGLCAEFNPIGTSEQETVFDLAQAFWSRRTVLRMRQAAVMSDPFTAEVLHKDCNSWADLRKKYRENASARASFQEAAMSTVSDLRREMTRSVKEIAEAAGAEQISDARARMEACVGIVNDSLGPWILSLSKFPTFDKSFDNAYVPETLEKLVRLETALDARIAKILARLVGLKEFKRTAAGGGPVGGAAPLALDSYRANDLTVVRR